MSFKFGKHKLQIRFNQYQNQTICLNTELEDGEPWLRLSTNLDNEHQSSTQIFVKENDEMFDSLVQVMVKEGYLKVVEGIKAPSGYNTYQLYEVLPKALSEARK